MKITMINTFEKCISIEKVTGLPESIKGKILKKVVQPKNKTVILELIFDPSFDEN